MPNNHQLPESVTWKAQSHQVQTRTSVWYAGFGFVSLGLILFAIFTHSVITLITFVLMIAVMLILSAQAPRSLTYKLTKTGIAAGSTVYPYKIIKTFWIVYNPPEVKTLNFETSAYLNNKISLELNEQDPVMVKRFLSQYLVENLDRDESITETLARRLKI